MFIGGYTVDHVIVQDPRNAQCAARSEEELRKLLGSHKCSTPMLVGFYETEFCLISDFILKINATD